MWLYKGKEIKSQADFEEHDVFGFIYKITNTETGKFYIGKKFINHKKTKKLGKKAILLQTGKGRKKLKEVSYVESDWIDYFGSSELLLAEVERLGKDKYKREIIHLAFSSKQLSYFETKYQFVYEVLEPQTNSYNSSILGKFFNKDVVS